jgi:hypothetical protein
MTDKTKACARSGSKRSAGECPVAKSPLRDPSILPEHRKKAAAILESGDPFAFLLDVFHRDHVGDHAVAACLLLSAVSSSVENARGLHVAISGTSGTGRTHACNAMLHLLPAAHRMEGPVSKNSLEFSGDMQPGTVLLFDGTTFPDDMRLLLKSATDNFREPAELRKLSRNRQLKILTTPERCVWWLSRMKTDGTDPIMNRLLIVPVDESGEQGQAVFDHLKAADAALMSAGVDPDVFVCRAIGECLRLRLPWVIIPFARRIHFPFSSNRRNLPMFLDLIKCHAALNFLQREEDPSGSIVATPEDFACARRIFSAITGDHVVQEKTQTGVTALASIARAGLEVFTLRQLQALLGLSYSQTYRLLHGYTNGRKTYPGILDTCPAIRSINTAEAKAVCGTEVRRRERYFAFDLGRYHEWTAPPDIRLEPDDDTGFPKEISPGRSAGSYPRCGCGDV